MTSHRKRKKQALARGLTVTELQLVELLEEVLDSLRWLQILGYGNQYLMERRLDLDPDERDRILEAATRVVDKDARLADWRQRLARIRAALQATGETTPEPGPQREQREAPPEQEQAGGQ